MQYNVDFSPVEHNIAFPDMQAVELEIDCFAGFAPGDCAGDYAGYFASIPVIMTL